MVKGYHVSACGVSVYGVYGVDDLLPHHRYIVTGFIDKNKDPIYQDFMRLLYNR